jgi:glycerate dehydrogenase
MSKPKTLVVTIPGMIEEVDLKPLREKSDVDYCELQSISELDLAVKCAGYDYLMLNMDVVPKSGSLKLTESFYAHPEVKALKSIAIDMTGMDYFSPKCASSVGVMLQNIPHYSSRSVAESVVAEILLHSRQRHLSYVDEIKGRPLEARKGINLLDRTVGIVGYGSIGSTVSEILKALGMKVVVWNRTPKTGIASVSLEELFDLSDVICVALSTVSEGPGKNIGIIGKDLLERCHGAIVVNLANELLVDPVAMASALESGKVVAYSVEDSKEMRSAYSASERVHFPPKNAWNSDESMQTLRDVWVSNVISVIDGKPVNVYRE